MKRDILMLSALAFVLFMLFAQAIPILDGDSAFYAAIAKNIVHSGDWMTLKFVNTGEIIDKPPFVMWMTALSFKLFGINEFAISLWQSIFALGIIILTYIMGKEVLGRRGGLISAIVLMLSAQFFYITRTPMLDIPLTFFITLAVYSIFKMEKTGKTTYYYPLAAACALGVLTKGPIALAIPAIIFAIYLITSKKLSLLITRHSLLSAVLFFAVTAPWFIVEYRILGQQFAEIFFSRNLMRFASPTDTIGTLTRITPQYDFYSYFIQIFLIFAPWGGFVYPAIFYSLKKPSQKLFLIWTAVAVFIFAFSLNYKIGRYILPAFPALAIIVGGFLDKAIERTDDLRKHILVSAWLNTVIIIPLFILATVLLLLKFPAEQLAFKPIALPFIILFSIGLAAGTILLFLNKLRTAIAAFTVITTISYLTFITTGALFLDTALPTKAMCQEINKMANEKDIIVRFAGEDPRQEYFYLDMPLSFIKDIKTLKATLRSGVKVYGITQDKRIFSTSAKILRDTNGYFLFSN